MIWLGIGTTFDILGYWGRIKLAENLWSLNAFVQQSLTLLPAPMLVAAAGSVTFKHIVNRYGPRWSILRPFLYAWVFVGTEFLSIFIQIVGGGWTTASAAGGGNETMAKFGEKLVIGGVAFQVVNIAMCRGPMSAYTA
ncbi:Uncharacterized protein Cob_v012217 [Colletotrichum orbiculare MAFF 240422]|uniref:Rta1 domain-containing protein n=1 Tax=Colletotrichum orbiculare (strain 104-T / ATCC 96160 / CBS 514.97 / LARS 414 / MAFF 240422) TaxID=1213857 RepID=A0A484F9X5_COLOR|nr:Uncharacterized protein Cob_v012217 [Colletotrichum orbiculare MAFF 240422]